MTTDPKEIFATLTTDVQSAIEKHLPAQIAATLAVRLQSIPELERRVQALNTLNNAQTAKKLPN